MCRSVIEWLRQAEQEIPAPIKSGSNDVQFYTVRIITIILSLILLICSCNHEVKVVSIKLDSLSESDSNTKREIDGRSFDDSFDDWIDKLAKEENPGTDIIAYKFGIFETPDYPSGYSIYLIGAKNYDSENDDWAVGFGDFKPANAYLGLPENEFKDQTWEKVQELIEQNIIRFTKTDKFKKSFLSNSKAIAVGFDDGDLAKVY